MRPWVGWRAARALPPQQVGCLLVGLESSRTLVATETPQHASGLLPWAGSAGVKRYHAGDRPTRLWCGLLGQEASH